MPRRKLTTHGTPFLTPQERSAAMVRAWVTRRRKQRAEALRLGLPDPVRSAAIKKAIKAKKGPPNTVRSTAIKRAWARRFADGSAARKQKRVLLSKDERSAIAKAAAALRRQRAEEAERKRLEALDKRRQAAKQRRGAEVLPPTPVRKRKSKHPPLAPVTIDEPRVPFPTQPPPADLIGAEKAA